MLVLTSANLAPPLVREGLGVSMGGDLGTSTTVMSPLASTVLNRGASVLTYTGDLDLDHSIAYISVLTNANQ